MPVTARDWHRSPAQSRRRGRAGATRSNRPSPRRVPPRCSSRPRRTAARPPCATPCPRATAVAAAHRGQLAVRRTGGLTAWLERGGGSGSRWQDVGSGVGQDSTGSDTIGRYGIVTAVAQPDLERVVVVGASLAGLRACETLRTEGFTGSITLVGDEEHLPYDRPPLSKKLLAGEWEPDRILLRKPEAIDELGLDLRLGCRAVGLDLDGRAVQLADDSEVAVRRARPRHRLAAPPPPRPGRRAGGARAAHPRRLARPPRADRRWNGAAGGRRRRVHRTRGRRDGARPRLHRHRAGGRRGAVDPRSRDRDGPSHDVAPRRDRDPVRRDRRPPSRRTASCSRAANGCPPTSSSSASASPR